MSTTTRRQRQQRARDRIREALKARDQHELTRAMLAALSVFESADEVEVAAREILTEMPHDVHSWWDAPCGFCQPQSN